MAGERAGETRPKVKIRRDPRPAERDPTLGIAVDVDRTGQPENRLVTIGDSITQGFMSGAIFRTDLSWPAVVAHEMGMRVGADFRIPTYEPPSGPGGLPLDLERAVRRLEARVGPTLDWWESLKTLRFVRSHLDDIEDYWERGDGLDLAATTAPYHNLAVYGADVLDVQLLDADIIAKRLAAPPRDNVFGQLVEQDNDRAWRTVLESCRSSDGTAKTVLQAARSMGDAGLHGGGSGPGIETLIVVLGANNALGSVVQLDPRWTPADYLDDSPRKRLDSKGASNVWQPAHFAAEWATLVASLETIKARHVLIATVPQVTIVPVARGWRGKTRRGSRYFPYYVRPWVGDDEFDIDRDDHITEQQARTIDSAIDAYNETIIRSVKAARRAGRDWYLFDLGALLDSLATKRYVADPAARPPWWERYELPPELAALVPEPSTRFFESGPGGRSEGGLFSLDGVHPTTIGYGIVAREAMRVMSEHAGVEFRTPDGTPRPPGTVDVDFRRVLESDSLISRPPSIISSTLSLVGWLDEAVDWIGRLLPFR